MLAQLRALGRASVALRGFSSAPAHAELIKGLRERTGAPIKDVKEVLVNCQWDQEAAFTELRKKGLAAATKKSSRLASEGLLGLAHFDNGAALVEINSETDFVARNELFQNLVSAVAKTASTLRGAADCTDVNLSELEELAVDMKHTTINRELSVRDAVAEVAAITGENVKLRRAYRLVSPQGIVSSYLHQCLRPGLARIAGLVSLEVDPEHSQSSALTEFGSNIAMHLVAAKPYVVSKELIDPAMLEHERIICQAQASGTGKAAHVIEKMVEGRLAKFFDEVVLLEQKYVADETKKVKTLLSELSKDLGKPVKISSFLRVEVGEGIGKGIEVREVAV